MHVLSIQYTKHIREFQLYIIKCIFTLHMLQEQINFCWREPVDLFLCLMLGIVYFIKCFKARISTVLGHLTVNYTFYEKLSLFARSLLVFFGSR